MAKKKAMTEGERWILAHLGGRKVSLEALRTKGMFRMARGAAKSLDRLVNRAAWDAYEAGGTGINRDGVAGYIARKYGPRPTPKRKR